MAFRASAWRDAGLITAALAGFLALGFVLENEPGLDRLRESVRTRSVPSRLLSYGSAGALSRKLRLYTLAPSGLDGRALSEIPDLPLDANPFQKKRKPSAFLLEARPAPGAGLPAPVEPPAAGLRPGDLCPGWPALSLAVAEQDLHDPASGILSNWWSKGPEWEREAGLAYYDAEGRRLLDARVGLRLHGGKSRWPGNLHSYRLHFRGAYGLDRVPEGLLFSPEAEPVRQVVVWNDWPVSTPFTTALAFDVARQAGCLVPELHPVLLFLNGRREGIHYLLERPTRKEWVSHFGHTNFLFFIYKRTLDPEGMARHEALRAWARNTRLPMTLAEADRRVDMDNLSRWIFAMVFCGTSDGYQGPAILDKTENPPRWRWLNWDMDHSFARIYPHQSLGHLWQKDHWSLAMRLPADDGYDSFIQRWDIRGVLFTRLMAESPEFRDAFIRLVTDLLNHRLTPAFADERIAHYRGLAQACGLTDLAFLDEYRRFLAFRPFQLREAVRQILNLGPTLRCRVTAPPGRGLRVDGYPAPARYQGWYFPGQTLTVETPGMETHTWRVNGRAARPGPLTVTVAEPLDIAWDEDR